MNGARFRRVGACLFVAAMLATTLPATEEFLFEQASSGVLELAGQSRLRIEGFQGTVFVRAGKAGELRYSAATRAARKTPHDVALWLRGGTMIFRPVAGMESSSLILEVALSEGVRLDIRKSGGKVQVASVLADVSVQAVDAEVDIRGAGEGVQVRVERGALRLENLRGPTSIDGTAVSSVVLSQLSGQTDLTLTDSSAVVDAYGSGQLAVDLNQTPLEVRGSAGRVAGNVLGGRVALTNVRNGGSLVIEEAPLMLARCNGSIEIDTDSEVRFTALQGSLGVKGYGAAIVGDGHGGDVTVESRDAVVELNNITGPLVLTGEALEASIGQVNNAVSAELSGSTLRAEGLRGGFEVSNEFGDVSVNGVEGATRIVNRNGSVAVIGLSGTVEIDAEGPEVRVVWREVGRDRDSTITNAGGDLYVDFPVGSGARVEAEADSIETELANVVVEDGGRRASGLVGEVDTPVVTLKASGRLVLSRGAGAPQ